MPKKFDPEVKARSLRMVWDHLVTPPLLGTSAVSGRSGCLWKGLKLARSARLRLRQPG